MLLKGRMFVKKAHRKHNNMEVKFRCVHYELYYEEREREAPVGMELQLSPIVLSYIREVL